MKTLLIANRKGGVGKTTTAANLAGAIAKDRKKVLLIDLDTQGNLGGIFAVKSKFGIHNQMLSKKLRILKTKYENIDIVSADINFDISKIDKKNLLKKLLRKAKGYDWCIIDSSPSFDILMENALKAADFAIIPMQTDYLSLVGLKQFLTIFYQTVQKVNVDLRFLGVVPTMFNRSIKEHKMFLEDIKLLVGKDRVFEPIRRDYNAVKYYMEGKIPVLENENLRISRDYIKLYRKEISWLK